MCFLSCEIVWTSSPTGKSTFEAGNGVVSDTLTRMVVPSGERESNWTRL